MSKTSKVVSNTISEDENKLEILVLGAEGSGKTLFVRRINEWHQGLNTSPISTIPTVGTEMTNITIKKSTFLFREVGSSVSGNWPKYLGHCRGLVYVIDIADPGNIANSFTLFHELLINKDLSGKPIIIVLNKCDIADSHSCGIIANIFRFHELVSVYPNIQVVSGTSVLNTKLSEFVVNQIYTCLLQLHS